MTSWSIYMPCGGTASRIDVLLQLWSRDEGTSGIAFAHCIRGAAWLVLTCLGHSLYAAPFGLIDWLAIPAGTRAKSIGACHGVGNVVMLLLEAVSWYIRSRAGVPSTPAAY